MSSLLFDDRGQIWDARSCWLAEDLCSSLRGEELVRYAVRNLGFIAVKKIDRSLRIRLRPAVVSPIAFSALVYYLADNGPERVLVSVLDRDWRHALFGSLEAAIQHLLSLCRASQDDRSDDFVRRSKALNALDPNSALGELYRLWRDAGGPIPHERLGSLLERGLQGRYVLVERHKSYPDLTLRAVGPGFLSYDQRWLSLASGLRVEDQPDYYYGQWVAQAYREVTRNPAPRLEDVDAIINTARLGRSRVRYTRLIVPVLFSSGPECLLGASLIDPAINLRVEVS
jgi:hypothetical protein